jgi:hypothetical protein
MHGSKVLGFLFAEKQQRVSPYFHILAFNILVHLTILSEHLSLSKHGGKYLIIQQVSS